MDYVTAEFFEKSYIKAWLLPLTPQIFKKNLKTLRFFVPTISV